MYDPKTTTHDFSMMHVMHDALRRELERLARATAVAGSDPRRALATATGWELFKRFLTVHHTAEDDALWDVLQARLTDKPDELALLAAMEAEHAAIDPLLAAIDDTISDAVPDPAGLAGLVDELATTLRHHLAHEEADGLALLDRVLPPEDWAAFGQLHRQRIGPGLPTYLPWLVDDLAPDRAERLLGGMPAPLRSAYRDEWRPAYDALTLWPATA